MSDILLFIFNVETYLLEQNNANISSFYPQFAAKKFEKKIRKNKGSQMGQTAPKNIKKNIK